MHESDDSDSIIKAVLQSEMLTDNTKEIVRQIAAKKKDVPKLIVKAINDANQWNISGIEELEKKLEEGDTKKKKVHASRSITKTA